MSVPLAALVLAALALPLRSQPSWSVARDGNIEVYSHRGAADARAGLLWLEQIRSLVRVHLGIDLSHNRPVSVFGFQSNREYEPYRLRATTDAYYVGTDGRDYIVLPTLETRGFATAAHEYAHLISHAAGAHVPPWLGEGLADLLSTVRFTRVGAQLGGEPFGRLSILRNRRWLPLATLLSLPADAPIRNTRTGSDIFYAQSWALTEMLLMSPQYGRQFPRFVTALSKGAAPSAEVLEATYGKPLAAIARDLEAWVRHHKSKPLLLSPAQVPDSSTIATAELPDFAVETMLGTMLLMVGDLSGAESNYRRAAQAAPADPSVLAGLAAIGLAKGKPEESRGLFAQALAGGLTDADLCFRYAHLLDRPGGSIDERRAALERAVTLQPGFDDARYALALLEKNVGNDEAALTQLRAMHEVAPARAYHYWLATADALLALGRQQEAVTAARKAVDLAPSADERANAAELVRMAQTHLAVRAFHDSSGRLQFVTTRAPNGIADWNPFIEPTDEIRRAEGKLLEIDCSGPVTRWIVETATGRVVVAIPEPSRVQMRHAPDEFVCGPQPVVDLSVEYAVRQEIPNADGIMRGVAFR